MVSRRTVFRRRRNPLGLFTVALSAAVVLSACPSGWREVPGGEDPRTCDPWPEGGHIEFFKYMIDLLKERGADHIKVYGGGGGVIVPREIAELEAYGVAKIFSPEDGRTMGLDGMIDFMMEDADFDPADLDATGPIGATSDRWPAVSRAITRIEAGE